MAKQFIMARVFPTHSAATKERAAMKRPSSPCLAPLVMLLLTSAVFARPPEPDGGQSRRLNEAEKKFQKTLTDATLRGFFTRGDNQAGPQPEKYSIKSVTKITPEIWLFQVRIQYGDRDLTLPLPLRVLWAGTTPVIALDKVPVPPLGVFSARVVVHDHKYAGIWDAGDHGGHLFGVIEPTKEK
jgi:hypothetical protein